MFKNLSVILDNLLDHIIYKTLKKDLKNILNCIRISVAEFLI